MRLCKPFCKCNDIGNRQSPTVIVSPVGFITVYTTIMSEGTGVTIDFDTHANRITDALYTVQHDGPYNEGDILLAIVMKNNKDNARKLAKKYLMMKMNRAVRNITFFAELLCRPSFNSLYQQFSVETDGRPSNI